MDRIHHEARLDRHRRAIAAVDPLDRARDQAVADITEAGAAIFGRDGRAKQPELAQLAHDLAVEALLEIGGGDARQQLLLRIGFGGVADEPLLVGELMIEVERILPVERQDGWLGHGLNPAVNEVARLLAGERQFATPANSPWTAPGLIQSVMAPCEASATSRAYLARTPLE